MLRPSGVFTQNQTPHQAHTPGSSAPFLTVLSIPLQQYQPNDTLPIPTLAQPVAAHQLKRPLNLLMSDPISASGISLNFSADSFSPSPALSPHLTLISSVVPVSSQSFPCPFVCLMSVSLKYYCMRSPPCYVHLFAHCLGKQQARNGGWRNVWRMRGHGRFLSCEDGDVECWTQRGPGNSARLAMNHRIKTLLKPLPPTARALLAYPTEVCPDPSPKLGYPEERRAARALARKPTLRNLVVGLGLSWAGPHP